MNNKPTQKELELEIMELEDELAYKKEQLERLYRINTNGRYFLDEGGGVRELIPPVNILAWEKVIRQGNTFKTVEDAEKESDRRTLLYEFNQFRDECIMAIGNQIGKILTCLNILWRLIVMDI